MKIMIAYPPLISEKGVALLSQNRQFQWFSDPTYIYPVVPAQAATLMNSLGHNVIWADGIGEEKTPDDFWDQIKKEKPDLLFLESKTPVIKRHWKFIDEVKKEWPDMIVVLVGDHATAEPKESMEKCKVDYILTGGNYDFLLKNLVEHIEKGIKLEPGIWLRKKHRTYNIEHKIQNTKNHATCSILHAPYTNTGKFVLNHDLNDLPPIDRDLTKWKLYAYKNGNYKYTPGTYIMSARDCWWGKCTFCSWTTLYPNYKQRSVKNVLDEIGTLIKKYGIKEIMDDSGSFPAGKWLREFCHGMIKRGYHKKVVMDCNMRFGMLTQDDWNLMGKAGFRFILFGLESANQKTLDKIDKGIKVADIEKGLRMAKNAGLQPHITTMMGYPWESRDDAQKTINLAKEMFHKGYVDTLQATIVIPYPGTPLYKYCKENNLLRFADYARFDQREQVMKSPLSTKDVQELTSELYKSFVTPKFIARKIVSIRSWEDVKFLSRAAGKVLGHLTDFSSKKNECEKCNDNK